MNQSAKTKKNSGRQRPEPGSGVETAGRTMPESLEAEAAVLGSMMLDPVCIGQVVQQLNADSFYRPEHQIIFEALVTLYEDKRDFDMVLLRDELKKRKRLKAVGGVEYLVSVTDSVPAVANVEYYIEIVKDKALLRRLVLAGNEILNTAYDEGGEVGEKLDEAERKIFALAEKRMSGVAVQLQDLLKEAFEKIEARKSDDPLGIITGLPTGYYELDDHLGKHNLFSLWPRRHKRSNSCQF